MSVYKYFGLNNLFLSATTDPGFVNAAAGDFHLRADSPLRGKGVNLSSDPYASITDFDGNPRPIEGNWDIGAYEYVEGGGPAVTYGDVNGDAYIDAQDAARTAHISVGNTIDFDRDGDIDASDGAVTLQIKGGTIPDIPSCKAANVDLDQEAITAYDAALIAKRAVGLITKFPVEG